MGFKINQAALEAAINQGLREKQDEIIARAREVVETQYCSEHGRFAELADVHGQVQVNQRAQLQFDVCCDALRERGVES
jgi:hypothetical protein